MSSYVSGHAPTSTDYDNAVKYAADVMSREACESDPDNYEWVPSRVTTYPCVNGTECSTGVCKFTRDACLDRSEKPYYDCVTRTVDCDTHPSGKCEICDYSISLGHKISGPHIPEEEGAPPGCYAGDFKFRSPPAHPVPFTTPGLSPSGFCESDAQCAVGSACVLPDPDEVFEKQGVPCETSEDCGGGRSVCSAASGVCVADVMYEGLCVTPCSSDPDCAFVGGGAVCGVDPADAALYGRCYLPVDDSVDESLCPRTSPASGSPYTVDGVGTVGCSADFQCSVPPGVGGRCGMDPTQPTYGLCYDAYSAPYLEWRDEIPTWDGLPPNKNVCVETFPMPRMWCEMPWTRPGMDGNSGDPSLPLDERVKLAWKSKARPPFWYDERDGTCHVTKRYCSANLKDGGFSAGYGRSVDYFLGSTCTGGDTPGEVIGAYDCCTKLGDAIGSFFLGRTLTTDFRELVEGDTAGFGDRWETYLERGYHGVGDGLSEAIDVLSDPRLKRGIRLLRHNVFGPAYAVHGYEWTWSGLATHLYGVRGVQRGVLTTEMRAHFPDLVHTDAHGFEHISLMPGSFPEHAEVGRFLRDFQVPNDLRAAGVGH